MLEKGGANLIDPINDIEKIKKAYKEFELVRTHFLPHDKYYYGHVDALKKVTEIHGRCNARIKANFVQKLVDEEALYSFGYKPTFKAIDESQSEALKDISYYFKSNRAGYFTGVGKKLVNFGEGYELSFYNAQGKFKNKWITPLEGYMYFNEYDESEFFMYIHKEYEEDEKNKGNYISKDHIDLYDESYVYYLDSHFVEIKPKKKHNIDCIPVGVALIDNEKYEFIDGYEKGDTTIFTNIKSIQDAYCQNFSDIVQEITDYRNAILKFYNIDLQDKKDSNF